MRLGVMLPLHDIGDDPTLLRDFAPAIVSMGYTNLGPADHMLSVNVAARPGWGGGNTLRNAVADVS